MSLLTAPIVKNSHIYAEIYFIFLKKGPKTNLQVFQYEILTSVERSEKQLGSKATFSTFLQLGCLNFKLKLCERPWSYKSCEQDQVPRCLGRVRRKAMFPETIIHKVFEKSSSFHVK